MTTPVHTRIPALGQAWLGDWRARVFARLRAYGFDNIVSFVDSNSPRSLVSLAELLSTHRETAIDYADIAAEQIAQLWREEAARNGPGAIEHMARSTLVGELNRALPEGWMVEWSPGDDIESPVSRFLRAISNWTEDMGSEHAQPVERVFRAMVEDARAGRIPAKWLPKDAADPLLVSIFAHSWDGPR